MTSFMLSGSSSRYAFHTAQKHRENLAVRGGSWSALCVAVPINCLAGSLQLPVSWMFSHCIAIFLVNCYPDPGQLSGSTLELCGKFSATLHIPERTGIPYTIIIPTPKKNISFLLHLPVLL